MRCGVAVSLIAQTGQSEAIHSPEACARTVLSLTIPAVSSIDVVCTVAISCWLKVLRTISSPLDSGAYRNDRSDVPASSDRMAPTSDFSGIDELGLRFGQGRSDRANRLTGPLHGYPPRLVGRN